jgi:hypothetical protein
MNPADLPQVYDEFRQLAAVMLAGETPRNILDPKALVHEACFR